MAITKSFLKGLSITDEQIEAIFEAHAETVNGLKDKIKTIEADKQIEVDALKKKMDDNASNSADWEKKYKKLEDEFKSYKTDQQEKETINAKTTAYKGLLKEAGISEKRIDSILKVTDMDAITLGEDGTIEDSETTISNIKEEWADFIVSTGQKGANVPTPPKGKMGMTKAEIMSIKSAQARQQAISENMELFTT